MSSVIAQTEVLAAAAGKLHTINEALKAGNAAAAAPTVGVIPAAGDLVSALTAAKFASHAQAYQRSVPTPRQSGVHGDHARRSSGSYAATEAANAAAVG